MQNALEQGGDQNAWQFGKDLGETIWQVGSVAVGVGSAPKAAPQGGLVGGGNQVFIPRVDPAWIVK